MSRKIRRVEELRVDQFRHSEQSKQKEAPRDGLFEMNKRIGSGKARRAEAVLSLGISLRFEESGEEPV